MSTQLVTTRPASGAELSDWSAARYGDAVAQRFKRDGAWAERTFAELGAEVRRLAAGLRVAGVKPGDRVALLCETRPEWTLCDLALARVGAICVPIYPTNAANEIEWALQDSGARLVIIETAEHAAKLASVRGALPELRTVVGIDVADDGIVALDSLLATEVHGAAEHVVPEAPLTIMYTSGTTGRPKGCVLTHRNFRAILDSIESFTTLEPGDVIYAYLPLAHLFTRMVQLVALESGATLAYTAGDIRQIVAELAEIEPTHLPSVPRLFEKVYAMVTTHLATLDERERASFDHAVVRAAFGGRIREALTGAAPIAPEILEFFATCGVPIYEAYGMTEATAVITANRPGAVKFGTVGRPVDGVEVRIADDGEICSRSAGTFAGYWNNPAATAEAIVGGWLHTGDLGEIDSDGYLRVTGRKKDIIITAGGKNLTPANIENELRRCRWIAEAVMCGDRRPYPVGLITLDPDEVFAWARERGVPEDLTVISRDADMHRLIADAVETANRNYAPPERIRTFAILPNSLTIEDGELTPTLKVRRAVVSERYVSVLEALYRG